MGGKGLFVKELEAALAEGRADLAVHSLKDVPMDLPAGFVLAAVWEREDARDAFVSNHHATLAELPRGARVGTSSLRRQAQLLALRPDLDIQPLRGNLDTRLRKLDEGGYHAIVLAAAGLKRLGLAARIRDLFDLRRMIPAAGQGALGLEVRADEEALRALLALTTHRATEFATVAERAVSRALGGSCSVALAAHARWQEKAQATGAAGEPRTGARLFIETALGHARDVRRPLLRAAEHAVVADAAAAQALGESVAARLMAAGAAEYLAQA